MSYKLYKKWISYYTSEAKNQNQEIFVSDVWCDHQFIWCLLSFFRQTLQSLCTALKPIVLWKTPCPLVRLSLMNKYDLTYSSSKTPPKVEYFSFDILFTLFILVFIRHSIRNCVSNTKGKAEQKDWANCISNQMLIHNVWEK